MRRFITRLLRSLRARIGDYDQQGAHEQFWSWFQSNAARLSQFEKDQERIFDELQDELAIVHAGLAFEIGPVKNGSREIAISADGIPARFAAVQALVSAAPSIPGWRVVAFRQRKGAAYTVHLGTLSLGPGDIWFRVEAQPGRRVSLYLYIRGFVQGERERFTSAVYLMLDDTLGEYDVETKIGGIDIKALPESPEESGLRPLPDLATVVDGIFAPKP